MQRSCIGKQDVIKRGWCADVQGQGHDVKCSWGGKKEPD